MTKSQVVRPEELERGIEARVRQDVAPTVGFWVKSATGGLLGGAGMGLYEMMIMRVAGKGLWTPLNLIAATLPWFSPPGAGLSLATGAGLLLHMVVSMFWGLSWGAIVAAVPILARNLRLALVTGLVYGVAVWFVMGQGIGPAVDPAIKLADPLPFFIGHLVYGVAKAFYLTSWTRSHHYLNR